MTFPIFIAEALKLFLLESPKLRSLALKSEVAFSCQPPGQAHTILGTSEFLCLYQPADLLAHEAGSMGRSTWRLAACLHLSGPQSLLCVMSRIQ